MECFDLIIRGANVHDGSGGEPFIADVGIRDTLIAKIGPTLDAEAATTVDANGLVLAPGIIDVHTHYDAQITWDRLLSPSTALGVTTVVMGNCGFSLAPCPAALRPLMMENLAVVEGMNPKVLEAGIRWEFESFGEYLDQIARSGSYPNVAVFAGHSAVRMAVMGEDASKRIATDSEIEAMKRLVREALDDGAIGFATSITKNHIGFHGLPVPSRLADQREMEALTGVLGTAGRGVFGTVGQQQTADDFVAVARRTGRPVVFNAALYSDAHPRKALDYLDACKAANDKGLEVYALVSDLPLALEFSMENAFPFFSNPAWEPLQNLGPAQFRQAIASPAFRRNFLAALQTPSSNMPFQGNWRQLVLSRPATERYAELDGLTLADIAGRLGREPIDALFDIALDEDLKTLFTSYSVNGSEDGVEPLIRHEAGLVSASDAGAHIDFMCNAGYGLHLLGHWVRNRRALSLPDAVRRLTSLPARIFRIPGRGRIATDYFADMILFDPANVGMSPRRRAHDLPAGGSRVLHDPIGLKGTWVNGVRIFDGKGCIDVDRSPGRVLRSFTA